MTTTRRLAAILAADVVGYSRLMGADEEGALERLKALRRELLEPKIAECRGRIPGLLTRGPDHRRRPAGVRAIIMDRSQRRTPALVAAGQIEELALDVGEQTWRKEPVGENPGPARYGLEASIRPLVDIMLGDDDPTRFVVQPDRSPDLRGDLDPDGVT